ncbi:sigma factor-like helix-turn-helix DNA-binding protein [Knoellia sinensis]|nr:sigma factor-like helix-turn-helix DNA-binding protein [Knoellia sinensis]
MRQTHDAQLEFNWLSRHGAATVADVLALSPAEVGKWRGFGVGKVSRITDLVGRLHREATALLARQLPSPSPDTASSTDSRLMLGAETYELATLVEWARFSSGAATIREALDALAAADLPDDVEVASRSLLDMPLPAADLDPLADLHTWIASLDDREARILERRLIRFEASTLDDVGKEFDVSRERVRQLESKLKDRLELWVGSDDGRSVRWALHLLSRGLGACAPDSEVPLVGDDGGHSEEFGLLLYLAGMDWDRDKRLIHRRGFSWPRPADFPLIEDGPLVDEDALRLDLRSRGVVEHHLPWAVEQLNGLRRLQGTLVLWPSSLVEQAIAVLARVGSPLSDLQIAAKLDREEFNLRGMRDRIFQDPRIIRVTKDDFALASWGLPEYGGIVTSMMARLEEVGPTPIRDLAEYLAERHSIKSGSVTAYSSSPVFVTEDGLLRLRRVDEPFMPRLDPSSVRGLFTLDSGSRIAWHVRVDRDLLRGSGRSCPAEIAVALGVFPGHSVTLSSPVRDISIRWIATTHMGPNIGSLRAHAEAVGARLGDELRLVFDRGTHTLAASRFAGEAANGAAFVGQLLDVPPNEASPTLVADAISSQMDDLEPVLRKRGDAAVADAVASLGMPV